MAAAMQTFWQLGYHHASLRDLLAAMQVSRSTLYHSFGNKEALFLAALGHYRDRQLAHLADRLAEAPSAWGFIEQLLYDTARDAESEQGALGCLIFNSATELGSEQSPPAQAAQESLEAIIDFFTQVMKQAQREGGIPAERDSRSAARFLAQSIAGLRMLLKSGIRQAQAEEVAVHVLRGLH